MFSAIIIRISGVRANAVCAATHGSVFDLTLHLHCVNLLVRRYVSPVPLEPSPPGETTASLRLVSRSAAPSACLASCENLCKFRLSYAQATKLYRVYFHRRHSRPSKPITNGPDIFEKSKIPFLYAHHCLWKFIRC